MSSTYTSSNKFEKPATGEQSGSWGSTVDNDLDLIDQALDGYAAIAIPAGSTSVSLNIANGTSSAARSRVLVFTGSPSSSVTVQVVQNTVPRWWIVFNNTGQSLVFSGAGTTQATVQAHGVTLIVSDGTTGCFDTLNSSTYIRSLIAGLSVSSPAITGGTLALTGNAAADSVTATHGVVADTVTANSSITAPVVNATTLNVPNLSIGSALSVPSLISAGDVKAKTITGSGDPSFPVAQTQYSAGVVAIGTTLRGTISTQQLTSSTNGATSASQPMIGIQIPAITNQSVVMITPANQKTAELYGTSVPWINVTPGVGFTLYAGAAGLFPPTSAVGQAYFAWSFLVIL